ncbi:MAG: RNA-directed DNA polymerase, partial [Patescibacteria group bacterium]
NIYMNEFDQFVKHGLKVKNYVRYADDFVFVSEDKALLGAQLVKIDEFLRKSLKIELHPNKVSISTLASGVDFLGWVHFPHHRVLRTTTKRRMFRKLKGEPSEATLASYRGMLSHGEAHGIYKHLA